MTSTEPVGWFTMWRCGCCLVARDHLAPTYCPHHAPGMTTWSEDPAAARHERIGHTEPFWTQPAWCGLEISEAST